MDSLEVKKLLTISVIFLNNKDNIMVEQLGYRILLLYCNRFKDYKPLYDVSLNNGFYPIVKLIESNEKYESELSTSYLGVLLSSFSENYKFNGVYLSEQQKELFEFFHANENKTVSVVAPTSYGKSELIVSLLAKKENKNVCILVPTKALLSQTKKRILNSIVNTPKVITHPEMYIEGDEGIIAVLTQERLLRLLRKHKSLSFDLVFVDEAHNLLESDGRSLLLAATIAILEKRNNNVVYKFLTPFLIDSVNLYVKYTDYYLESFKINEYMKSEKFFIYDFRTREHLIYDQFVDDFFELDKENYLDDVDLIIKEKSIKNLVYLNKPYDIEHFSERLLTRLQDINSERINEACKELSEYLHPDYFLIECLRKGFIYHHGSVPDNVRTYIEHLFSSENDLDFVITSSTLLEGVNLPIDQMFLLDNKKGRGKLSPSQFKNLIGRVSRFSEVFSPNSGSTEKLEPKINLIASQYVASNANLRNFIRESMKVDRKETDDPTNVLLKTVDINKENVDKKNSADEFIENFERGIVDQYNRQYVKTEVGKNCFLNNIVEIDILKYENEMQELVDDISGQSIDSVDGIFKAFTEIFLPYIIDNNDNRNLRRLTYSEARRFYSMFLTWRIENASYREMINSFIRYWNKLIASGGSTDVFVGRWGDKSRDGYIELWTDIKEKSKSERINLAIVRIKDEQDFLDNIFIKYVEVLNDLGLLAEELYERIKYGTSDKDKILLIKNGFSNALANMIVSSYRALIKIDHKNSSVSLDLRIIDEMMNNNENDILIHEALQNVKM